MSTLSPAKSNYSHSYLQRYRDCPLACYYHNELKLRKREEGGESHHMAFSKAQHEGLRHLYANNYATLANGELKALLREAQDIFLAHYPTQLNASDLAKTRQGGITALAEYVRRWKDEDKRYRVLSVESLDNQEDGFVVKLDLVVQDIATEQILGMDHKVTGKYLNYDYWAGYEPDSQIVEYERYIQEKFGFCDGFIINAIALRYLQRASKNGPAGLWCNFERQTFNVNGRQMEADLASRRYWIDRIEHSKATGVWGMNTNQCKFCEYRDLCKAGWFYPDDAELIDISYRRVCGKWFRVEENAPLVPCQLDRDHEGDHAPELPSEAQVEFEIEV
jgi:hypothetical protein